MIKHMIHFHDWRGLSVNLDLDAVVAVYQNENGRPAPWCVEMNTQLAFGLDHDTATNLLAALYQTELVNVGQE